MNISFNQVERIVVEMVKASNEINKARESEFYQGDDEYIGYREGLYDAYLEILFMLGYSVDEVNEMETKKERRL